jgi:hypothetical protein
VELTQRELETQRSALAREQRRKTDQKELERHLQQVREDCAKCLEEVVKEIIRRAFQAGAPKE